GGTATGPNQVVTKNGQVIGTVVNGQLIPGVTPTTVTIGGSFLTDINNNNATFGADAPAYGDPRPSMDAVIKWVNEHGGVAGRNLQIYWQPVSQAHAVSDPNYLEEVCRNFTEDHHVFAVVDFINRLDAEACYPQHHTLLFDESPEQGDQAYYKSLYPYLFSPAMMAADRQQKTKLAGLNQVGYFNTGSATASYKLGVIMPDDPRQQQIYDRITRPLLARYGVKNIEDPAKVRESSIQALAQDLQSAVVRFAADGVDHVIIQGNAGGGEGGAALLFMRGAFKQQYYPRYGLGTNDAPGALEKQQGGVQPELSGGPVFKKDNAAVSVGWAGGGDVEDANGDPWPSSPAEKRCVDIENAATPKPQTYASRVDALVALGQCASILLLWQATKGMTTLTADNFARAALALGTAYESGTSYASQLGPNHFDSPSGFRLFHAEDACANVGGHVCFRSNSPTVYPAATIDDSEP
ncbi:MAG: hypothetical protein M3010_04190, partial [Candidatus Dormibacteraeota bacterium]|nr:hypothetical protein [Candidatus Dormibacteraeota bacterium]